MAAIAPEAIDWDLQKALAAYPPTAIGPTWVMDDETGMWMLPKYTLGWAILEWAADWLTSPDGSGDPFIFTAEQARFILWYYAIDEHGEWLNTHGVLQRLKGWGKDPLGAALCIIELAGPCRFDGWNKDGTPRVKQHPAPYVQLGAVSLEQTENTRDLFQLIIPERTRRQYGLNVQTEIIYAKGRGKLKCIASNARSSEGGRVSFFLANEIHHWTPSNGGKAFFDTLLFNLEKVGGRFLAITNAYQPGENSVLESIREDQQRVWDGMIEKNGWMYDSLEGHPAAPLDVAVAPFILEILMGDSHWLKEKIPRIVQGLTSSSIPPSRQRRMWYNQVVSTEESVFSIAELDACVDRTMTGTLADLQPGDRITLGFDGSRTDDATALVAFRLSDKCLIPIQIWERPAEAEEWTVDTEDVDSMVGFCFATYDVVAMYADMKDWESYIAQWSEQYRERLLIKASTKNSIGFDMRGNKLAIQNINETMIGMVRDAQIKLNGSGRLKTHFLNAERRWGGGYLTFGKKGGRESKRKIDALIASTLALKAGLDFAESGKNVVKKTYTRRLVQH